jgi:hypothetical protein
VSLRAGAKFKGVRRRFLRPEGTKCWEVGEAAPSGPSSQPLYVILDLVAAQPLVAGHTLSFSWHLQVSMTLGGRSQSLAYCYTAVEAAHAHDVAKLCQKGPYQCSADDLNFSASDYKTDDLVAEAAKLGFLQTSRPTQTLQRQQYVSFLCDSRWLTNPPNLSHTTNEVGCGMPSRKRVADTTRAHIGSTGLQGSHECCMSP